MSVFVHQATVEKSTAIPDTPLSYFLFIIKPYRTSVLIAVLFVVSASGIAVASSYLFKFIIDAVEADNYQSALFFTLMIPVVEFLVQLLYRGSGVAGSKLSGLVIKNNFDTLAEHTLKHSHSYFTNRFAGSLMSKVQNVVDATENLIHDILWSHITSLVTIVLTLTIIALVDWRSGLVFLVLIAVLITLNRKLSPGKRKLSTASSVTPHTLSPPPARQNSNLM